jgi:hypothetical protein
MAQTKKATVKTDKNNLVVIKLDRPRFIRFGHKALKKLGALTGKSINSMNADEFDLEELEKILYCGLLSDAKEHGESLELADMEDLLDCADNFMDIVNAMNEALDRAFEETEKQKN